MNSVFKSFCLSSRSRSRRFDPRQQLRAADQSELEGTATDLRPDPEIRGKHSEPGDSVPTGHLQTAVQHIRYGSNLVCKQRKDADEKVK